MGRDSPLRENMRMPDDEYQNTVDERLAMRLLDIELRLEERKSGQQQSIRRAVILGFVAAVVSVGGAMLVFVWWFDTQFVTDWSLGDARIFEEEVTRKLLELTDHVETLRRQVVCILGLLPIVFGTVWAVGVDRVGLHWLLLTLP